jgi:hypothetical protein
MAPDLLKLGKKFSDSSPGEKNGQNSSADKLKKLILTQPRT